MALARQAWHAILAVVLLLTATLVFFNAPSQYYDQTWTRLKGVLGNTGDSAVILPEGDLPCRSLPGAEDVVVVLKTGSTEFQEKFPVHINTTLRCYPNSLVFSDYAETFKGVEILDALESIDGQIKMQNDDFELWRQLRQKGRSALLPSALASPFTAMEASPSGNTKNPGWKLDKWKFLPMMNRTYHEYPGKKWYLFVETDTYILWQTALNYFAALDSSKPWYIGSKTFLGDTIFAHGGTGYVLSSSALENVVMKYRHEERRWTRYVEETWAGDAALGQALEESGAQFLHAWPIFQGDEVGSVDYNITMRDGRRLWCSPTVSYHHLSPMVVEEMWRFEQVWIANNTEDPSRFLRHKDMFEQYVLPRLPKKSHDVRQGWNNAAKDDRGPVDSMEDCREICENDGTCIQYLLDLEKRCKTSTVPRLGEWARGKDSAWILDRVDAWYQEMESCSGEEDGWILE